MNYLIVKLIISVICIIFFLLKYVKWKKYHSHRYHTDYSEKEYVDMLAELKPHDFIVTWGSGIISYTISLMENLLDYIKNPPTHTMHIHKDKLNVFSAESSGYKLISLPKILRECSGFVVCRFKIITQDQRNIIDYESCKFDKKGYNFYMYFRVIFRVLSFFIPFVFVLTKAEFSVYLFLVSLFLYIPVMKILKYLENKSAACSSTESYVYNKAKLIKISFDHISYTPYGMLDILMNMKNDVEVIIDYRPFNDNINIDNHD